MGNNYDKYCTCFNKNATGLEASLTRQNNNNNHMHIQQSNNKNISSNDKKIKSIPIALFAEASQNKANILPLSHSSDKTMECTMIMQKISYPNGDDYEGNVVDNKREGKGKMNFASGGYYNGDFHNDIYEGYGTLCSVNNVYHGNFIKGVKHGEGRSENRIEGTEFKGNWENGLKHGHGKETFSCGSYYEGYFIQGKKNGEGYLKLSKGSEYCGQFVNDTIEGKGTMIWNKNQKYIGNWKHNCLSGFGAFISDKDKHIGYFDNDQKKGLGFNYFFKSKSFIIGKWNNDALNGFAIYNVPEQGIQLWQMKNNKMTFYYQTTEEKQKQINTVEYQELKEFYNYLLTNDFLEELEIESNFLP